MAARSPSVASEALKILLVERGAKAATAAALGVGAYQISKWLTGDGCPSTRDRAALEDALGLHWRDWDADPTDALVEEAVALAPSRRKPPPVEAEAPTSPVPAPTPPEAA